MSIPPFPPPYRHEHGPVKNANEVVKEQLTFGQRASDWIADKVGSWQFIISQSALLCIWALLNATAWVRHWDPYPFILMNLVLSLQAAYLTATALELIGESTGKAYIFPTPHNDVERPVGDTALAVAVGRNLKFPLTDEKGQPLYTKDGKQATVNRIGIDQFTPHDLRRTAATFMSQLGEHDEVIDAILNHAKKGIIATYNQNRYDREKQQALESWERKLLAIITGKGKDNVVSIGTAKKHLQTA